MRDPSTIIAALILLIVFELGLALNGGSRQDCSETHWCLAAPDRGEEPTRNRMGGI